jgi:hypothetical protein
MFITHSGTSKTFFKVSFAAPVLPLYAGEKIAIGGLEENILKKLKGATLGSPFALIVLAKQIGRGAIAFCKYFCKTGMVNSLGSNDSIGYQRYKKDQNLWRIVNNWLKCELHLEVEKEGP